MQGRPSKRYMQAFGALYGNAKPPVPKAGTSGTKPATPKEAVGQAKLVAWARSQDLPLISIPNDGHRTSWQADRLKALGLTPGVSDLFLAVTRGGLGGMWIEMKRKGCKPSELQYLWLTKMRANGYRAEWYDDWELARDAIKDYLR